MSMYGEEYAPIETGPGRTRQSMRDETNINNIMRRYKQSGLISHVAARSPVYMDVADVTDYRDAVEQVRRTEEFFKGLTAKVRARFNHDPAEFLDFMTDSRNEAEAKELGLVKPEPEPPIDEVPGPGIQSRGADGRFESPK